jgi:F-type H+-transporting ATPase subunit epsilon
MYINLKIVLPYRVFVDVKAVADIVVESNEGSIGILPRRQDGVLSIVPGILNYKTESGESFYVAVDEGILIKEGPLVLVSVRNAVGGTNLGKLHETVKVEFEQLSEDELVVRSALAKLESGFIKNLRKLTK